MLVNQAVKDPTVQVRDRGNNCLRQYDLIFPSKAKEVAALPLRGVLHAAAIGSFVRKDKQARF